MSTFKKSMTPEILLDEKIPLEHRKTLFGELCTNPAPGASRIVETVLKAAAANRGKDLYQLKRQQLEELIAALESGPQRPGTFVGLVTPNGTPLVRAHVKLPDGTPTYPVVPDPKLAESLHLGDGVLLSAKAEAVLGRDTVKIDVGQEARLEECFGDRIEVSLHGDERHVMHPTESLRRRIEAGEVTPASRLLVCQRREIAFDAVPQPADELSGFRFLDREKDE